MHSIEPNIATLLLWARRVCADIDRWGLQLRTLERALGLNDQQAKRRAFKWTLAACRFKATVLKFVEQKAGFNPNQPRWPAGSGRISGQWSSGGAGSSDHNDFGSQRRDRRDGHHYLPRAVYRNLPLSDETRKVFADAKTGPLHVVHGWSEPHARYNEATQELMDRFLRTNGIAAEQMSPDQARSLVKEIQESKDPRIRDFNMKIRLREFLYRLRIRTRGNE